MSRIDDLAKALDRVPVALYRTAPDGTLVAGNRALAQLFGFSRMDEAREYLERVGDVYVNPQDRELWIARLEDHGVVYDMDIQLRKPDGTIFWVRDAARAIRNEDGEIDYYEGALVDVTDKIKAQRDRDEFIATISHELRNPIAVLVGMGSELATSYDSFSDEDRRDMAILIQRQAEDAAGIIEDLLVESHDDMRLQVASVEFDVADEVRRVLEVVDHEVMIHSNGASTMVEGDPRRTRQILRNLVTNAIRYGTDPLEVRIKRSGRFVEMKVCDSGDPISLDDAVRIFEPYQRIDGTNHPKSVGLGLGVARKLARLMGGDIEYQHDGTWSSFVLSLPASN